MHADSCPDLPKLQSLKDGPIADPDALLLRNHVEKCSTCRSVFQSLVQDHTLTRLTPGSSNPPINPGDHVRTEPEAPIKPFYPFLKPPAAPDEIGRLGNYRVLRLLGKGGWPSSSTPRS